MPEPSPHLEVMEILKIVGYSVVSAIGAVVAWWRGFKDTINAKIAALEKHVADTVKQMEGAANMQATKIAVLEAHQANNIERLDEIKEAAHHTNAKLDDVQRALTDVLLEIKHRRG